MQSSHIDTSIGQTRDNLLTPVAPNHNFDDERVWNTPPLEQGSHWAKLDGRSGPALSPDHFGGERGHATPGSIHRDQAAIDAKLVKHIHHLSPNLALPPVDPARRLSSSPLPDVEQNNRTAFSRRETGQNLSSTASSLQTPPSSASSLRHLSRTPTREVPFSMANSQKNISNNARTLMPPPDTPSRVIQASPQFFPSLQFSPDMYQFQMPGLATAPVLPQQRLFWDPSNNLEHDTTSTQYQDSFMHTQNGLISPDFSNPHLDSTFQPQGGAADHQPYDLPETSRSEIPTTSVGGFADGAAFPAPFTTSPRIPHQRTEDPSLFLSSPARRFGGHDHSNTGPSRSVWDKPAYHHQIEESKRERELARARKAKAKRVSGVFPLAGSSRRPSSPAHDPHPGLKRSLTHTGVGTKPHLRNQSHVSFAESISSVGSGSLKGGRGGRSSPLKTSRDSRHLGTSLSRQRASLTFAIDEDGRAKTVITKVQDPKSSFMDLDDESPSSSDESMDEPDYDLVRSQQNSFAFSERDLSPQRHHNVTDLPRSHLKNSSYSTLASKNSAPLSSWTSSNTSGSRQRHAEKLYGKSLQNRLVVSNRGVVRPELDVMDEDDALLEDINDRGDAQQALRAIIRERPRSRSTHDGSVSFHSSPPIHQTAFGTYNGSPTTITDPDGATPSTDRESLASNNSTRCTCNSTSSDGQFMIQCESCSKWLHVDCVNVDPNVKVYICGFCTQTPMRHGRIREPARSSSFVPASPLAHKSHRFR